MLIRVTQDDIRRGLSGSPVACALALAVRRCVDEDCEIHVSACFVEFFTPTQRFEVKLPEEAQDFRERFDKDRVGCRPIEFRVEVPLEAVSVVVGERLYDIDENNKTEQHEFIAGGPATIGVS